MLKDIKEQFKKVVAYSQGIDDPQVDELFDRWLRAKRDFIEVFDGKLIYEVGKVSFNFDETTKKDRFESFLDYAYNLTDNYSFYEFLKLNKDSFYSNIVDAPWKTRDGKAIPKGMKLLKAFKYFEPNSKHLEELQNTASRIIQENKIEGTLCFSVHPLDYLSVSENSYNWRSCHALDGEYRAGNLSYMVDDATVVCYLKGAENVKLPNFPDDVPWNSKKWRVLFYVSNSWDVIFAGKQYPFGSDAGVDEAKDEFLKVLRRDPFSYSDWMSPIISEVYDKQHDESYDLKFDYIWMRGELKRLDDVVIDGDGALQFNDVLRSSVYQPHYTAYRNVDWLLPYPDKLVVGSFCNCLRCGKDRIRNPETMQCNNCELEFGTEENDIYGSCDCCGCRIVRDEATAVGAWDLVCDSCKEEYCFTCEHCGEVFYKDDRHYDEITEKDVCLECLTNMRNARRGDY